MDPQALISNVNQNGFWQGLQNYIGNNTNFGNTVNSLDNGWQSLTGQPKQQLIGQPAAQTNPAMATPNIQDHHLSEPDANGIRPFNDAGKAFLAQSLAFNTPTKGLSTDESQPEQSGANSNSGTGKDLVGIAAALL